MFFRPEDVLRSSEPHLQIIWTHVPALRPIIDQARRIRAAEARLWNDPIALRRLIRREGAYRWISGYIENELNRGIDAIDADRWQAADQRIRVIGRRRRITVAHLRAARHNQKKG